MAVNGFVLKAGPWLAEFAKRRGPEFAKWIWENKKEAVGIAAAMLSAFKWASDRLKGDPAALRALARQVDYLVESADDDEERRAALEWRRALEGLRRGYELARHAPTPSQKRAERKKLKVRLERLRLQITDAYVEEQIEDHGGPRSRWASAAER